MSGSFQRSVSDYFNFLFVRFLVDSSFSCYLFALLLVRLVFLLFVRFVVCFVFVFLLFGRFVGCSFLFSWWLLCLLIVRFVVGCSYSWYCLVVVANGGCDSFSRALVLVMLSFSSVFWLLVRCRHRRARRRFLYRCYEMRPNTTSTTTIGWVFQMYSFGRFIEFTCAFSCCNISRIDDTITWFITHDCQYSSLGDSKIIHSQHVRMDIG